MKRLILCAMVALFAWPPILSAKVPLRTVHVFVALADNAHQGIVPVPAKLGDGDRPDTNLYWGAAFGVKTYFRESADWQLLSCSAGPKPAILQRCVFRYRKAPIYLVADAYQGSQIRQAVTDFLSAAAGLDAQNWIFRSPPSPATRERSPAPRSSWPARAKCILTLILETQAPRPFCGRPA